MFSHSKRKVVAVADVGSGSVGIAVMLVTDGAPLRILVSQRSVLTQENRTPDQLRTQVIAQLGSLADTIVANYAATKQKEFGPITSANAVIRVPWTRSNTVRVFSRLDKEKTITQDLINTFARQAFDEEKLLDHTKLIETSIVRVELNGYPTSQPVGKSAHQVAVSVLMGECDSQMKDGVTAQLSRAFTVKNVLVRSGTQAVLSFLRQNNFSIHDSLIIDMSGEATNMIVVRKGISVGHEMIAEGVQSIIARCAGPGMPEETKTLIRMVANDQCNDSACDAIIASLAKAEPELVRIFGEALSRLGAQRRIPNACILIVDTDMAPWLSQFFSRIDFSQFTTTMSPFFVTVLSPQGSPDMIALDPGVSPDAGLDVASAIVRM